MLRLPFIDPPSSNRDAQPQPQSKQGPITTIQSGHPHLQISQTVFLHNSHMLEPMFAQRQAKPPRENSSAFRCVCLMSVEQEAYLYSSRTESATTRVLAAQFILSAVLPSPLPSSAQLITSSSFLIAIAPSITICTCVDQMTSEHLPQSTLDGSYMAPHKPACHVPPLPTTTS